jgi:peptide deformylase
MFVLNITRPIVVINPVLLKTSKRTTIEKEGCLSLPEIRLEIDRPKTILVQFYDEKNKSIKCNFDGLTSRAFQHELNHIEGILITDLGNKL